MYKEFCDFIQVRGGWIIKRRDLVIKKELSPFFLDPQFQKDAQDLQ